jgi:GT2 family glycosyltransferase
MSLFHTAPYVSVVVPTRGRPQLMQRCLSALLAQDAPHWAYEILIVDDSPEREIDTASMTAVGGRPSQPGLRVLHSGGRGPAAARNVGWRGARAPIIAFTDDDTVPARSWLSDGLRALEPDLAAIAGRVIVPTPPAPTDYELDAAQLASCAFVTANCFVRRSVLEAIGGFDERYTLPWREDSDLHFALMQHGYRLARASAPTVLHPVRPAPWGVSLMQQRKVQFDALLYRKYPRLYRRYIRSAPRWDYYLTVLLLLSGAGLLLAGWPLAGAIALGGWALLTLVMTLRRLRGTTRRPAHVTEMLLTSAAIPPLAVFWRAIGAWRYKVLFL